MKIQSDPLTYSEIDGFRVQIDTLTRLQQDQASVITNLQNEISRCLEALGNPKDDLLTNVVRLINEVKSLRDERFEMHSWFDRRSVTGELSLEEIDAMSPRQMADYVYERKANQLDKCQDNLEISKSLTSLAQTLLRKRKEENAGLIALLEECVVAMKHAHKRRNDTTTIEDDRLVDACLSDTISRAESVLKALEKEE